MNSNQIFEYSDHFFEEILQNLTNLKTLKVSDPKNNDFENKLRTILGKNFNQDEFKNFVSSNDQEFKKNIIKKFKKLVKKELNF